MNKMLDNMEVWKDCKGYEGLYQVSNMRRIWSVKSQKILKQQDRGNGYLSLNLYAKNGKKKKESVHRLVALAFIPNPNGLVEVNHIDENKYNNCASNLEWCDKSYNINHGTRNERVSEKLSKQVLCVELNMLFDSAADAVEYLKKGDLTNIHACCRGVRNTCSRYHWRYVNA